MNIYRYHDGVKDRYGDPMRIKRLLSAHMDGSPKALFQKAKSPIPEEALPAEEKILEAVRKAFELVPFDPETGEGATEEILRPLVNNFWEWCQEQKKNGDGSPTSPGPTASQESPASSDSLPAWAQTPTTPSSGSG